MKGHYDKEKADRVMKFISHLRFVNGAKAGLNFNILGWQEQFIRDVFGCVYDDGCRQFREVYLEIPKKNGKSTLCAAIGLYMLMADGERGAQVYSLASSKEQAGNTFKTALYMIQNMPELKEYVKIRASLNEIFYIPTKSVFKVLSSDPNNKQGLDISCCLFDELADQKNRTLFENVMRMSGSARKQPLYIMMTTAGVEKNSVCYEMRTKSDDIIRGNKVDEHFYPVVYSINEDDDWNDEKSWIKANPSIGEILDLEQIRSDYLRALNNTEEEMFFRRYRLCEWASVQKRWLPMNEWDECLRKFSENDLEGRPCYAGMDLSTVSDLTAFVLVFPPIDKNDANYYILPYLFCPEESIEVRSQRDKVLYRVWARDGYLLTTPGNVVDYSYIETFIKEKKKKFDIKEIAIDPWNSSEFSQHLVADGFEVIDFRQGFATMSSPTKDLMRLVKLRKLVHNGNPVLRWNIDNIVISQDPSANIKITKNRCNEKVDGAVALVMALGRALTYDPVKYAPRKLRNISINI
jgi:phage terminase large subunit-like protein